MGQQRSQNDFLHRRLYNCDVLVLIAPGNYSQIKNGEQRIAVVLFYCV